MTPGTKKVVLHIAVWVLYIVFAILVYGYDVGIADVVYETVVSFSISASVFYIHACFLLPQFLGRKKVAYYTTGAFLLLAYNFGIRYLFSFVIDPVLLQRPSSIAAYSPVKLILVFSWYWFTFMLFSTGYWVALKLIRTEKEKREQEKLLLEHAVLKAQINPHFLFNTLDSFRIESELTFPEMARSITALVELLRSALSKPDANGLTLLAKEVTLIESVINIYQRRFPSLNLQYTKSIPNNCHCKIPQHVLLTFVENAFKYGDYNDKEKKMRIELSVTETELKFLVYNKKIYRLNDSSHGIGMKYAVQQLKDCYGKRYNLHVEDTATEYTITLKIALS